MKIARSAKDIYRPRARIMDELIKKAIKELEATRKPLNAVSWKPDQPHAQPFFTYDRSKQAWAPAEPKPLQKGGSGNGINRLRLYSWNIDFMLPFAKPRMDAALDHLNGLTSKLPSTTAAVIFLQECIEEDLETIGEKTWVRDKFNVTDIDGSNWQAHYGTTTLLDRRLDITSCFRVHYAKTQMERDALIVETSLNAPSGTPKTLRLCNSHLESLAVDPPLRPAQVRVLATHMRAPDVHGAVAAGTSTRYSRSTGRCTSTTSLKTRILSWGAARIATRGIRGDSRRRRGCGSGSGARAWIRCFFTGGLKVHGFERFGADVQVSGERERREIAKLGFERPWITDHLGVVAEFEVVD